MRQHWFSLQSMPNKSLTSKRMQNSFGNAFNIFKKLNLPMLIVGDHSTGYISYFTNKATKHCHLESE